MRITEQKSYNIQVLRGVAIIAVVFIHNIPSVYVQIWCRPFLNFCVGLFLFLSGMLSYADEKIPWDRIIKVVVPYTIWTFIYVIISNHNDVIQFITKFILHFVTGTAAPIMYYIFVYCQFTVLIPVIRKLANSKYKMLGFLISPIEIISMRLIPLIIAYKMNVFMRVIIGNSCLGWFTYFYLGYLIGSEIIHINMSSTKIFIIWLCSICLQTLEGYWYYLLGEINCGTQLKLSAILTGSMFMLLAFRALDSKVLSNLSFLHLLGDYSFGIFFSHLAIMELLRRTPFYYRFDFYPFNAIVIVVLSLIFVLIGGKLLGKYRKYFAF